MLVKIISNHISISRSTKWELQAKKWDCCHHCLVTYEDKNTEKIEVIEMMTLDIAIIIVERHMRKKTEKKQKW